MQVFQQELWVMQLNLLSQYHEVQPDQQVLMEQPEQPVQRVRLGRPDRQDQRVQQVHQAQVPQVQLVQRALLV